MRITHNSQKYSTTTIQFQQQCETTTQVDKRQQNEMLQFKSKPQYFHFPHVNNPEIDKFQKRILAFAKQYGNKNQKTTSIHMNYLQSIREAGINCLRNHDMLKACSFLSECLLFCDPKHDQVFYQKFLIVKIDVVNKLLYCLFEIENLRQEFREDKGRLKLALQFLVGFFDEIKKFPKYENLRRSENCLLQLNYFYLGRLYYSANDYHEAIQQFLQAQQLIKNKLQMKLYARNEPMRQYLLSIQTKLYYTISKCYRRDNSETQQFHYEQLALNGARIINEKLFVYIHRKIMFHQRKKEFQERLGKLDGRKRIEEEVLKLIEDAKLNQTPSLYDAYLHSSHRVALHTPGS